MAKSNDAALQDYLIGVLEADGPDAAERRLALRDAWHRAQGSESSSNAPAISAATDRTAEWDRLTALWDQLSDSQADQPSDQANLENLQQSVWSDVRHAANQLDAVRRQQHAISRIWPPELEQELCCQFLQILCCPAARSVGLIRHVREELHQSKDRLRAFRRFAEGFQREFPALLADNPGLFHELLEQMRPPTPLQIATKPAPKPNEGSTKFAWAAVACGVVGGLIGGITSTKHRPVPPSYVSFPPPVLNDKPFGDQLKAQQAVLATQILLGIDPAPLPQDADVPADALQPANRIASEDSP